MNNYGETVDCYDIKNLKNYLFMVPGRIALIALSKDWKVTRLIYKAYYAQFGELITENYMLKQIKFMEQVGLIERKMKGRVCAIKVTEKGKKVYQLMNQIREMV